MIKKINYVYLVPYVMLFTVHSGLKSQKHGKNMKAIFDIYKNEYSTVFEVADYESEVKMAKNKMADPIWRTRMPKKYQIWSKLSILRFSRSLSTNLNSKWQKTKWRIQYGGHVCQKNIRFGPNLVF